MALRATYIDYAHLDGVRSLLDSLQLGFVVVDENLSVSFANYWARQAFGRRYMRGSIRKWLSDEIFDALCGVVLKGESGGERWRVVSVPAKQDDLPMDVMMRSTPVAMTDGSTGVLLSIHDISGEASLVRKNMELLDQQRRINDELRKQIANKLREHEDDITQFAELLQVAPAIFASFLAEAEAALEVVDEIVIAGPTEARVSRAMRAVHTLKGNARSLGLNFIGGRAHGVEDLLEAMTEQGNRVDMKSMYALSELVADLRRARDRASFVRSLGNSQRAPELELEQYRRLADAEEAAQAALKHATNPEARKHIELVVQALRPACNIPLQELFEYLRATIASTSRSLQRECPDVVTRGGSTLVKARVYEQLAASLPHIVRNAVTHGLEPLQQRLESGKRMTGVIEIDADFSPTQLQIGIRDDGRGIDMEKLATIAQERGLPAPADSDSLLDVLCTVGVSTSDVVSLESGRGAGLGAAREAIRAAGGHLSVVSEPGRGTHFRLEIPGNYARLQV